MGAVQQGSFIRSHLKKIYKIINMPPISNEEDVIVQEEVTEETKAEEPEATEEAAAEPEEEAKRIKYLCVQKQNKKPSKTSWRSYHLNNNKSDTPKNTKSSANSFYPKNLFSPLFKYVQILLCMM